MMSYDFLNALSVPALNALLDIAKEDDEILLNDPDRDATRSEIETVMNIKLSEEYI